MNTESLAASLFQQLQQGQGLQQVSQQLGLDSSQTAQAVGSALPLLLGAMGQNASEPQGAQSLLNALQRDHSGGGGFDLGGILGAVMGGGGSGATAPASSATYSVASNRRRHNCSGRRPVSTAALRASCWQSSPPSSCPSWPSASPRVATQAS